MNCSDPDLDLVRRAGQGDDGAFARLQNRYRALVFAAIRKWVYDLDSDEQEDLAQKVWIAAWQALPRFRGDAKFSTFLCTIARNTALDFQRSRRNVQRMSEEQEAELSSESSPDESEIVANVAIRDCIKKLPET